MDLNQILGNSILQRLLSNRLPLYLVLCIAYHSLLSSVAFADEAQLGKGDTDKGSSSIQQFIGDWDVRQRMWTDSASKAIELPPAVAHRTLIGGAFLEETMTLAPQSSEASFTRISYFDYNAVSRRYEYFSLDTRAPQMMNERSSLGTESESLRGGAIKLYGGRFVAPQWGHSKNVPFQYRIIVSPIENEQHAVRLYLTPQSGAKAKEFLAFEYVYIRKQ